MLMTLVNCVWKSSMCGQKKAVQTEYVTHSFVVVVGGWKTEFEILSLCHWAVGMLKMKMLDMTLFKGDTPI